jgi:hypothetical protein
MNGRLSLRDSPACHLEHAQGRPDQHAPQELDRPCWRVEDEKPTDRTSEHGARRHWQHDTLDVAHLLERAA